MKIRAKKRQHAQNDGDRQIRRIHSIPRKIGNERDGITVTPHLLPEFGQNGMHNPLSWECNDEPADHPCIGFPKKLDAIMGIAPTLMA
jgi:hypothetical protein